MRAFGVAVVLKCADSKQRGPSQWEQDQAHRLNFRENSS